MDGALAVGMLGAAVAGVGKEDALDRLDHNLHSVRMEMRRMFGVKTIVLLLLIFPEESHEWLMSIMAIIGVWGMIIMYGCVFLRLVVLVLCPNFTEDVELLGSFLRHLGSFLCHLFDPLRRTLDRMNAAADPVLLGSWRTGA